MIITTLNKQIIDALKAKDETRLTALRMLLTALKYARIEKMVDLTEEDELNVVRKEAKKRKDAIEIYEKINEVERTKQERQELAILEEFLPQQMDDKDVEKIVDEVVSAMGADKQNMGKIMGEVMQRTKGLADGKKVAQLVNSKLS